MTWSLIHLMTVLAAVVAGIYLAGFLTCHLLHRKGWLR